MCTDRVKISKGNGLEIFVCNREILKYLLDHCLGHTIRISRSATVGLNALRFAISVDTSAA